MPRGIQFTPVRGAELYMLGDREQLVTFTLHELIDTMMWSVSKVCRVRVIERSREAYKEKVLRDSSGEVLGIRRSYQHDEAVGHRVLLTRDTKLASMWSVAESHRLGWRVIREECKNRPDAARVYGHCYDLKLLDQREKFVSWLVGSWEDPQRVIEGIERHGDGVFSVSGRTFDSGARLVAPVWVGAETSLGPEATVVGPVYLPDCRTVSQPSRAKTRVLDIEDIVVPRGKRAATVFPDGSVYQVAKRAFDVLFAILVLICFAPVFLLTAILVVLDDGFPIFFGHTRQKRGGQNFKCWKFRTMRKDAESLVQALADQNMADGPQVYIKHDPRVTRIGRILRKGQLDELPQFWNVLVGDMSVVGPRPSPDGENQFCPAWRELRLSVRPGITGLWQVKRTRAPGEDFQEWIRYDIDYVRRASFVLDMQIIGKTVQNLVVGR